eukprot:751779-Hanusia_phi.AAC.1
MPYRTGWVLSRPAPAPSYGLLTMADKKRKLTPDEGMMIHDFETHDEWNGNFIVLGTTGSGKTTLVRYMTEKSTQGLSKGGQFRLSLDSVTEESRVYKTPKIKFGDVSVTLKFRDTIGFGAKDMESKLILKETFLKVVTDFDKIRGVILVHKCERYREGTAQDLEKIKRMLDTMGLDIKKHLLVVVTHTAHLSTDTQLAYSEEIREKIHKDVPVDRIIHVNFAKTEELNDYHKKFFQDTMRDEFVKLVKKLMEFEDEVAPARHEIEQHFDRTYTDDLQKRPKFAGIF